MLIVSGCDGVVGSVSGVVRFCQNSVPGQNSIIPLNTRRAIYVLPALPVYIHFQAKAPDLTLVHLRR